MTTLTDRAVADRAAAAQTIILEAGALALSYFGRYRTLGIETKSNPQDIVSEADRQVEHLIRRRLHAAFADDGLVGEEHGLLEGSSGYMWLIDPIDGTSPFLHGLRTWCVAIALVHQNNTVLGLIYDPSSNELFSAVRGQGALLNAQPIRVDTKTPLAEGLTAISATTSVASAEIIPVIARLHAAGGANIRLGSAALTLAQVAAGRLVGYYEPELHSWDCVAGLLIVAEAGGTTRAFDLAHPLQTDAVFAAAPQVTETLAGVVGNGYTQFLSFPSREAEI